jgi:decaprenylphospho-beta-D-ribofuranose 2-oxidase
VIGSEKLVARGLGRSYGDAAVVRHGRTVLTERLDRFLQFDARTGVLECEAGVTINALIDHFLPLGFFPSVVPGTKHVTLGGAIAADVHGKNHHVAGAFSRHVRSFRLLTASGAELECSRANNADLFWATIGGMGLTGIITDVRLTLSPVPSPYVSVRYERASNIDDALELFHADDHRYAFSVAWIDCLSRGGSLGRAVLMRGDFAPNELLTARQRHDGSRRSPTPRLSVPGSAPQFVLATPLMRAFNAGYYHSHPGAPRTKVLSYEPFFFPLDKIRNWNRLYGRRGFLQYQCVLPSVGGREGLIRILEMISSSGSASFLAVLKRFGEGEPGQLLSFPRVGYTLALDLPNRGPEVFELLERLDALVVRFGGRVYLAKDARMRPETFRAMYPEFRTWLAIKNEVDPDWRFSSDLAVRLRLMD